MSVNEPLPADLSDKVARSLTMLFRWFADTFFAKRYGHRAVVLETVAGVPGMVAGMWQHLRSLRKMEPDKRGWIRTLLEEAENERMHLMIFIEIAKPNWFERLIVMFAQFVFWHFYFVLYVFFPKTAHRMIGYFENQAVVSYTQYLEEIDAGRVENIPAPAIAINYYRLPASATLRDVVVAVRADEQGHADVNHGMANELDRNRRNTL
jgi:ubiquinol oxidase